MTVSINGSDGGTVVTTTTQKVLQVVNTLWTGTTSTTSATPVDVSGFSATITPAATSSKILVTVDTYIGFDVNDAYPYILLLRGSTSIATGTAASGVQINTFLSAPNYTAASSTSQYKAHTVSKTILDSPNTTDATTYKIQFAQPFNGYTAYLNRVGSTANQPYIQFPSSSITLMEIGA